MEKIKWVVETMWDEVDMAKHYAKAAIRYRDTDKDLSELCIVLSKQELEHCDKLHGHVTRIIREHKAAGHEPPVAMMSIWEYEHEKIMCHYAKVKGMLETLK